MTPADGPARMHDTLVLLGAQGDLSLRYLFPSLRNLLRDRLLPPDFRIVAVGREPLDDAGFRAWLAPRLSGGSARDAAARPELLARVHYVAADLANPQATAAALAPYADRPAVSYLAIPPALFEAACAGLQAAGLLAPPSRLVLEKPIGHDLASSRAINAALRGFLDESRLFRIDHFLG